MHELTDHDSLMTNVLDARARIDRLGDDLEARVTTLEGRLSRTLDALHEAYERMAEATSLIQELAERVVTLEHKTEMLITTKANRYEQAWKDMGRRD